MSKPSKRPPVHPGRILKQELDELGISANALGLALRVPSNRVTEVLLGRRSMTADTALRLARFFRTSAQFWMNLQSRYDLEVAQDRLADRINADVRPLAEVS